jgi:hypothetical protein
MIIKTNKKAQMKIQQMAVMLMAVTLFFILVGMFVLIWSFGGIKESAAELEEKSSMLLVTKLANTPEFSCGNAFGTGKINCIDADKVMSLKNSDDLARYTGFWGKDISNIEIRKIYPAEDEKECTSGTYPDCNLIKLYDREVTGNYIWNFVSLCRKAEYEDGVDDKCELAKVFVGYTQQELS